MAAESDLWDVELLTSTHSLTGQISTHGRRVTDFLNDDSRQLIALLGVRSFSLDQPQAAVVFSRFAQVNKETILLVILERTVPDWVTRQRRRPLEYVLKDRHPVQIVIPPFQVTGSVHLIKGITLEQVLLDIAPGFIPLSQANIRYLPQEDRAWSANTVVLNRRQAQFLWPVEEATAPAPRKG